MRPWTSLATTTSLTANAGRLSPALGLHGRELHDAELPGERAPHGRLELARLGRREKADAAEVDAEDRHAAARHLLQGAQDGAVAAEHDHEVGVRDVGVRRQQLDAGLGRQARDDGRRRRPRCGAPAAPRGAR